VVAVAAAIDALASASVAIVHLRCQPLSSSPAKSAGHAVPGRPFVLSIVHLLSSAAAGIRLATVRLLAESWRCLADCFLARLPPIAAVTHGCVRPGRAALREARAGNVLGLCQAPRTGIMLLAAGPLAWRFRFVGPETRPTSLLPEWW
jgi:hypothetical protein